MGVAGKGLKAHFSGENLTCRLSCGLSSEVVCLKLRRVLCRDGSHCHWCQGLCSHPSAAAPNKCPRVRRQRPWHQALPWWHLPSRCPACCTQGKAELGLVIVASLGPGNDLLACSSWVLNLWLEGRFPLFPHRILAVDLCLGRVTPWDFWCWTSPLSCCAAYLPFSMRSSRLSCVWVLEVRFIYTNGSQSSAEKQLFFLGTARNH